MSAILSYYKSGPTGSDGISPYNVYISESMVTIRQFIDIVLREHPDECGYIGIYNGENIFGYPRLEYSHGVIVSDIPEKYKNLIIFRTINCSGGWGRFDYQLVIDERSTPFDDLKDRDDIKRVIEKINMMNENLELDDESKMMFAKIRVYDRLINHIEGILDTNFEMSQDNETCYVVCKVLNNILDVSKSMMNEELRKVE